MRTVAAVALSGQILGANGAISSERVRELDENLNRTKINLYRRYHRKIDVARNITDPGERRKKITHAVDELNNKTASANKHYWNVYRDYEVEYNRGVSYGNETGYGMGLAIGSAAGHETGTKEGLALGQKLCFSHENETKHEMELETENKKRFNREQKVGFTDGSTTEYDYKHYDLNTTEYEYGYDDGYYEGYEKGTSVGHNTGISVGERYVYGRGYTNGKNDWYNKGKNDGYDIGHKTGNRTGFNLGKKIGFAAGNYTGVHKWRR